MRILIFTEVFSPDVCGVSSYVDVLKKGLENLSHTVLIVTSSTNVKKAYYTVMSAKKRMILMF